MADDRAPNTAESTAETRAGSDARRPDPQDGAPTKQHGDPLLDTAQGRGSDDDGSRQGYDATAAARASRRSAGNDAGDDPAGAS
jgi:hypothetical protein